MPTDEERRHVAERLRELDYSDLQESLICAYLDALGIKGYEDWVGIAHRLADLIEPSCDRDTPQGVAEEMFGKMRHSTKEEADAYDAMLKSKSVELHPVDRDALLALADKMASFSRDSSCPSCAASGQPECSCGVECRESISHSAARRIREACGEVDG